MEQFVSSYVHSHRLGLVGHSLGLQPKRWVYATPEVQKMLYNAPLDARTRRRLLRERSEEIWEMRARDPSPGIRIFGRFVAKDKFIALTWDYKENSETQEQYDWQKANCKRAWLSLFVLLPPHTGSHASDYVTNAVAV